MWTLRSHPYLKGYFLKLSNVYTLVTPWEVSVIQLFSFEDFIIVQYVELGPGITVHCVEVSAVEICCLVRRGLTVFLIFI